MAKRERKKLGPCIFAERCGGQATSQKHGTCSACTSGLYYWNRKPAAVRAVRKAKLMLYGDRIDELGSGRVHIGEPTRARSDRKAIARKKFQRNREARS